VFPPELTTGASSQNLAGKLPVLSVSPRKLIVSSSDVEKARSFYLSATGPSRAVLALSVPIIVGAWLGHQCGDLDLGIPIFDTLLFTWRSWTALPHAARSPAFR
jgi:hypothetical protein